MDFGNCDGRVLYSFIFPFHLLLESATAEKQNCAFLLILRDNCAEKSLQISINAKSCLEAFSYTESLCGAERK